MVTMFNRGRSSSLYLCESEFSAPNGNGTQRIHSTEQKACASISTT